MELRIYLKMSSKKFRSNSDGISEYPASPFVQFAKTTNYVNGTTNPNVTRAYDKNHDTESRPANVADGAKILFKPLLHLGQHGENYLGVTITTIGESILHTPTGLNTASNTGSQTVITI